MMCVSHYFHETMWMIAFSLDQCKDKPMPSAEVNTSETLSVLYPHRVSTVNFLNIGTPKQFVVIAIKFELWLYHRVTSPNDADGMANSVDPDRGAV